MTEKHLMIKMGNYLQQQLKLWQQNHTERKKDICNEDVSEYSQNNLKINLAQPTKIQIKEAIKHMRNNKAAGLGDIPSEFWKADIYIYIYSAVEMIHPLLEDI